jgi:membrane protease subunit HflC
MNRSVLVILIVGFAVAFIGVQQVFYVVDEINYAVVIQFGEIQTVSSTPGLKVKIPFIQQVTYLEKRMLTSDTSAQEYLTSDQKRIQVDQITRWKIKDPKEFYLKFSTEEMGRSRLGEVILGSLRAKVGESSYNVMISDKRDLILESIIASVQETTDLAGWGIELIDVRIKRADLPQAVEQSVYQRMASARKVEADRYRAQGQLYSDSITSETDRLITIMDSCASRVSKEVKGLGEAEALAIYAGAYSQDPEFFAFIRKLEAYEFAFGDKDTVVMSSDSSFFSLLSGQTITDSWQFKAPASVVKLTALSELNPLTPEEVDTLIQQCVPAETDLLID